jgi:biopolymer transport protein ExbD
MIERNLGVFSLAMLGVVLTVFVFAFAGTPIVCGFAPNARVPWAKTASVVREAQSDLHIYVMKDQRIYVGPTLVPKADLQDELRRLASCCGGRTVFLHADAALAYGNIKDVLHASRDAGFSRISLVTFRGTLLEAWHRGGAV